jgi:UDP-2-acetamido-3-amino-2,3-dideoxy-glucuronate N-acetyltransferase
MDVNSVSVAVIGSGYWGKNLVRNFHALGVLRAVCDRRVSCFDAFDQQYPDVACCSAMSDIMNDPGINAVAIATPAETHHRLVEEALLAGKHVFVEKPLALSDTEAAKLADLADSKRLTLMVGHLLQYHPVFLKLKELVGAGELGRINYIYSNRLNLGKIRREENILWSFAPHDISMILALAGEEPETVMCMGGNYLHRAIADVTVTHLNFSSGLKAHVFVSWLHPFKEQKLVLVGEGKMAVFDDTKPWDEKLLLYPHMIHWENNQPIPTKAEPEKVNIPQAEPLREECAHFLACVASGRAPRTDGREGLRVLRVLNASQRSMDAGGNLVPLAPPKSSGKVSPEAFIHPSALVDHGATVEEGCKIWHFSHILTGSVLGPKCNIGQNVVVGPGVTVGAGCKIQNNVSVYTGVTLEQDVFCGPSMVFTNVFNPRAQISRMHELRPTLVKRGATLGANCTIVCGHVIGRYAFVGAGAVVTKDVPDHALVVGNPARRIGWMCSCGEKLDDSLHCGACGNRYVEADSGLSPAE